MATLRIRVRSRGDNWTDYQDGHKQPETYGSLTAARWTARHLHMEDDTYVIQIVSGGSLVEQWGEEGATE